MGYAKIFWIREKPIREYISANVPDDISPEKGNFGQWRTTSRWITNDDTITVEVGKQVLSLSAHDGNWADITDPLPLFDTPSTFFPFDSFHSTDFNILLWTGNRLCRLPRLSPSMFDSLHQLTDTVGSSHIRLPLSSTEYHRAIADKGWQNPLEQNVLVSLYCIHQDFSRRFENVPEEDWPCKEIGAATLNLMFSNWNRSESILNHGNALNRPCSFSQPEFTVFVWRRNSLQLLSKFEDDEIQRMRGWVAEDYEKIQRRHELLGKE